MGRSYLDYSFMWGCDSDNFSDARKLPPVSYRYWSMAGARLGEIASVQPTVVHRRQCQVSGEQFEIL